MKKFITNNTTLYIFGIFLIYVLWWILSITLGGGNLIFPNPHGVIVETGNMLIRENTYLRIWASLLRTLEGFGIALLLALILGLLAGQFKSLQTLFKPLILVLKSAPTAAFVFLFVALSGSKNAPIYVVILLAFPILYDSVIAGINNISPDINNALRIDSGGIIRPLIKVRLPLAIPYILVGLTSSFALSLKTEIMAEIITGSTSMGLGSAIYAYRNIDPTNLTPIFAITLIAIIIILIVDLLGYFIKRSLKRRYLIS